MDKAKKIYFKYLWWIWQVTLVFFFIFFFCFGILMTLAAYDLNQPYAFILVFFGSNLVVMISAVMVVGLIYRMLAVYRLTRNKGR